jgi:hypothetical protein
MPTLGIMAGEALDDYVEKMVERSPNVRLIREEESYPANSCLGAVCLRNYVVMFSDCVD